MGFREATLFPRDEAGNLLSVEVELSLEGNPTVRILPITRGKFAEIYNDVSKGNAIDQDNKIIVEHCIEPKYTDEEVKRIKPVYAAAIIAAILEVSLGKKDVIEEKKKTT